MKKTDFEVLSLAILATACSQQPEAGSTKTVGVAEPAVMPAITPGIPGGNEQEQALVLDNGANRSPYDTEVVPGARIPPPSLTRAGRTGG